MQTINGAIPGPILHLNVNDTVVVRLRNLLTKPLGLHWHGVELENSADGTPYTMDQVDNGHSFLYKFKVPRPGIFWYHPHHMFSTNQVFRGIYGAVIVADPYEGALILSNTLPSAANTMTLVLSDITVCRAVGSNPAQTYPAGAPWVGGGMLPAQGPPTPLLLCETHPLDDDGMPAAGPFGSGDVPGIMQMPMPPALEQTNEGNTVLTNGMNVGGRAGTPNAPGALDPGAFLHDVTPGQGLRLQICNCSAVRYMRLLLTSDTGVPQTLVRVGGEGGLLDHARVEGGVTPGGYDMQYNAGEILIPAGSRADIVAVIPAAATPGVWTLWTLDYQRTGNGYSDLPSVPVMHLNVTAAAPVASPSIGDGTPLRAAIMGAAVIPLGPATTHLMDPTAWVPPKLGRPQELIQITHDPMTKQLGIDNVAGTHDIMGPYSGAAHLGSSRYAAAGPNQILELSVQNTTSGHHPFHLHGFSMQPKSLTKAGSPTFTWPYNEYRDVVDIPGGYTYTFRIRLDDRPLEDGVTMGGSLGRWMFHCHILFHADLGMISELVVTSPNGHEKPNVNVAGSWAYAPSPAMPATRTGTYVAHDGTTVTLQASEGNANLSYGGGTWTWNSMGLPGGTRYVYITATDSEGRQDQTVFRLRIGGMDDGADQGDPHLKTVDGVTYDFQAVGEFTLLRGDDLEIQVRQAPVPTATPIADAHSGLKTCVSINTAVAARVGSHTVSFQPHPDSTRSMQFFLDGKLAKLSPDGLDLGLSRVSSFAAGGGPDGMRVDFDDGTVLTVAPAYWADNNVTLLNIGVANTTADEGIMGRIAPGSWLPALPNGASVGPMPAAPHDRYLTLYKTFANAWRVTPQSSLFVYAPGKSTDTYTDRDWPAEHPPCKIKPGFVLPGSHPPRTGISTETAERLCAAVTVDDLHRACVFDVSATGDKSLAKMYEELQDLRVNGSAARVVGDTHQTAFGQPVVFTAVVSPIAKGRPIPTGAAQFIVDGNPTGKPVTLDKFGRAHLKTSKLAVGGHLVRAEYKPGGKRKYHPSASPNCPHTVVEARHVTKAGGSKRKPGK